MRKLLLLLTLSLLSQAASAAPIVYDVNEMFSGAKAVGTITTDGKIGRLAAADIIDFNLFLDNGFGNTVTIDFSSGLVLFNGNADVEASASFLQFFPSSGGSFTLNNNAGTASFGFAEIGYGVESVYVSSNGRNGVVFSPYTFGTARASLPGVVPEPASIALFGLGVVALVTSRRRRKPH